MQIRTDIWTIDTTSCSWEEFKSMIDQKISEQVPGGETIVSADDDWDDGRTFNISYFRKESMEEKQNRLEAETEQKIIRKRYKDENDWNTYIALKRKFDKAED